MRGEVLCLVACRKWRQEQRDRIVQDSPVGTWWFELSFDLYN